MTELSLKTNYLKTASSYPTDQTLSPCLELTDIHCRVGEKTLLKLPKLDVFSGQMLALLGPNGAGKTTLLKAISGDIHCSGSIELFGKPIHQWPPLERAKHLGVLPQSSSLAFPFTAHEVVAMGLTPLSLSHEDGLAMLEEKMKATDCHHLSHQPYPLLSGGERQRVHLARVLLQLSQATHPPLLLLDEPTSAQDLGHQHQLLEFVSSLCTEQNVGVVAILHDLNQVLRYCNECCILHNNHYLTHGKPDDVLTEDLIDQVWHYKPRLIKDPPHHTVLI